jgi:glycosyltransferase involved in cell wall biosynthesis
MKILIISRGKRKYGGSVYEDMVGDVLSDSFEIKVENFSSKRDFLLRVWNISQRKDFNFVIRNFDSCLFLNPKPVKNIAIVHHIDYSFAPFWIKLFSLFSTPLILKNLKKTDAIVVVSKYWENYFRERGYKNVFLIYNGFDLNDFNFSDKEIEEFKEKYNLTGKPIIYLGNCQLAKGVVESYQKLKDLNCHFVTSGKQKVKIPARNLELEYGEYLKLLKASFVVVVMSKFNEGWCRTCHEAMLLKTPVIGSGKGGMRELVAGGKQIICEDFSQLKEKVEYLLKHPEIRENMGQAGFDFAKNFTKENFAEKWRELIFTVSGNKKAQVN